MRRRRMPDEFELIERYFAPLAEGYPGALGLADDAALIKAASGCVLVAAADALVAGVHFRAADPAPLVARKLLRVNLSDLAAMGARPIGYLLSLVLPRGTPERWVEEFAAGLAEDQKAFAVSLLGGDTVATDGPLTLALTALGEVEEGSEVRRAGARVGDAVCVSGTIGDGALGLRVLRGEFPGLAEDARRFLAGRYRLPEPRLALGRRLAGVARAAIDVSDGLVADLAHVCAASGVGAEVDAARLPLSDGAAAAVAQDPGLLETVLTGGDDYEILFAARGEAGEAVAALSRSLGLPLTVIGRFTDGEGVRVVGRDGRQIPLPRPGYRHF